MMNALTDRFRESLAARYEPEGQARIARGYWSFLVVLFLCALAASIAYGAWEFIRPLSGETSASLVIARPRSPLDRAELQALLVGFDERVRLFEERQAAPPIPEP